MKLQTSMTQQPTHKVWRIVWHSLSVIGVVLLAVVVFLYSAMALVCYGPSKTARDLFVTTCMETSFAKLFPPLLLSDTEIKDIIQKNAVVTVDEITDTEADFTDTKQTENIEQPDIEIKEVTGATYKGKMMIVKDPSRVVLATPASFGEEAQGEKLDKLIEKEKAVGGVNAGGFADDNGVGNGGTPTGMVIKDKELKFGSASTSGIVIGFDDKNVLHVGKMTAAQAKEKGIRDAVSFGPILVVNSNPAQISGSGGGLNPRTAIGQREDGSVLLLVIDGRQPHSLGATYKDLVDVMVDFGAVNAGNLDGGSSSMMYYNGELQNICASLYGPRKIATGFVVI